MAKKCKDCENEPIKVVSKLEKSHIEFIEFIESSTVIRNDDVNKLFKLYNLIFNRATSRCNCPGQIRQMVETMVKYKNENK